MTTSTPWRGRFIVSLMALAIWVVLGTLSGLVISTDQANAATNTILVSTTQFTLDDGDTAAFGVKLSNPPSSSVDVTVRQAVGDATVTFLSPTVLTFTPADWDSAQRVRFRVATDADPDDDLAGIVCQASGWTSARIRILVEEPGITDVLLSANPYSPVVVGTPVTVTARIIGGPYYRCQFRTCYTVNGTNHWNVIKDWSRSTQCTWTPEYVGNCRLMVHVLEYPGTSTTITRTLYYKVCAPLSGVVLTANPPPPCAVNSYITLCATPTGGAKLEYLFRCGYQENGTWRWVTLRTFSTNRVCHWRAPVAHSYVFVVWVRECGTTGIQASDAIRYVVR